MEQAGTVLGMCVAAEVAPGRNVLMFCDNTGAKNAAIRGYSKNAYARGLTSILWSVAAKANVLVWAEYVKSAPNHADPPSRICNETSQTTYSPSLFKEGKWGEPKDRSADRHTCFGTPKFAKD